MEPQQNIKPEEGHDALEVVIGVFDTHFEASRVAASLRGPDVKLQKVSRSDPAAPDQMPEIVYDDIEEIASGDIATGAMLGGAIGAGSGLLLMAVPVLNVLAPIAGALAGAWIGTVAGVDEANRGIELPNQEDYRKMLAAGKSFVVLAGDESKRIDWENKLKELGAIETHQHPPVQQTIR